MSSSQARRQELIFISRLSRGGGKQVRKSDPILTYWIGLFSDLFNIEKDCLGWERGRRRREILWHILCPLVSKHLLFFFALLYGLSNSISNILRCMFERHFPMSDQIRLKSDKVKTADF